MVSIQDILSKKVNVDDDNLIEASEKFLEDLKRELDNDNNSDDMNLLETNYDIFKVKQKVETSNDTSWTENAKILKTHMDENNKLSILNQKLTMDNYDLSFQLKMSEKNSIRFQKEMCTLQDTKSKLMSEIKEKEECLKVFENNLCKMRSKLEECSKDNECMAKYITTLELDLSSKTMELNDERLYVKRLKDTMEKYQEEKSEIENKLKCYQLKQKANSNKKCESVRSYSNDDKSLNACSRSKEDEILLLTKQNKELTMENEYKDMVINLHKKKYRDAKCELKQMRLYLEKPKYEPLSVETCEIRRIKSSENTSESKSGASCAEKCQSKRLKLSPEMPKREAPCCTTNRIKKQANASTCCKLSPPRWKPRPLCCKPSPPCCTLNPPCCKPSTPCCEPSTPCCKPSTPCCEPSTPCCKPSKPCCEPSTPCCKPSTPCCKPSTPCCKPSKPCCEPSTPCCEPSTCTCKTSKPCSKSSTCKTSPGTCKPSSSCSKPSSPCSKPSSPCCKTSTCTCKTSTCTCKTSPCTCKTSPDTCKTSMCSCKPGMSCSSCKNAKTIPLNQSENITNDEDHCRNELQKGMVELRDLKSYLLELSKIK